LYYNGFANAPSVMCGGVPCSPPPVGVVPDVEAANTIAFESQQPIFSFLGTGSGAQLSLSFGTTTAFDYVAFPAEVQAGFAAPGAALIAGPSTFPPFIPPDTVSGTQLQTNIIMLNLNINAFLSNTPAAMSVTAWNWFDKAFKSTHQFLCWERIPINLIDPRLTAAGPFGANYGQIRFTPNVAAGNPQLLGAVEQVSTVGRTVRNLIHNGTAPNPASFVSPR